MKKHVYYVTILETYMHDFGSNITAKTISLDKEVCTEEDIAGIEAQLVVNHGIQKAMILGIFPLGIEDV